MPEPAIPGVAFTPPPSDLQPSISRAIADAVASIPPGHTGALVGLVNERGANAAIVAHIAGSWEVQAYIGKTWHGGALQYGGVVRRSW